MTDFKEIDREYAYSGALGADYTRERTVFRFWSPVAERAEVLLYRNGEGGNPFVSAEMTCERGVWSAEISGDLHGVYYTYAVTRSGKTVETIDIYAKSAGLNGRRGMVLDLSRTDPALWSETAPVRLDSPADAVIYELHVRDFSMDESGSFKNRGKFAAFCEEGVTNRFGDRVGLDYIADLGVTHIHLLPIFDFATVDESAPQFNWGYDPQNYNVPEGSYSLDPREGLSRVRELKSLVMAAHKRGLGVVMDVVYNHTHSVEDSPFTALFPDYYYRKTSDGTLSNGSGCGNEFASERKMASKFICDSLCYWAREYKLDGFRFDLMGLLDIKTLNRCARELRRINPDILLYGEGWTGGCSMLSERRRAVKRNVQRLSGIAVFSDDFRDGVKGSVFCDEDCGFVNGDSSRRELIKSALLGGVFHPEVSRPQKQLWADSPLCCVNYVEAHDNLTLFDKLRLSMPRAGIDEIKAADKLAAALVFFAQGIPFIQAGQELLRSKPAVEGGYDHDSYRSPDSVNSIKWDSVTGSRDVLSYYRGLIAIRREFPELRRTDPEEIRAEISFSDLSEGAFLLRNGRLLLAVNPSDNPQEFAAGKGLVLCDEKGADPKGIRSSRETETVPPHSVLLLNL